jgi:hypothetical protein
MNKSKELRELFRLSQCNKLDNKTSSITFYNTSKTSPMYSSSIDRVHGTYEKEIAFGEYIKIFFYEWSDVSVVPKTFQSLVSFEGFLRSSGIPYSSGHIESIKNLGTVFCSCYRGTRTLVIRSTYHNLYDAMRLYNDSKSTFEASNTSFNNDGTFFG